MMHLSGNLFGKIGALQSSLAAFRSEMLSALRCTVSTQEHVSARHLWRWDPSSQFLCRRVLIMRDSALLRLIYLFVWCRRCERVSECRTDWILSGVDHAILWTNNRSSVRSSPEKDSLEDAVAKSKNLHEQYNLSSISYPDIVLYVPSFFFNKF